MRKIIIIIVIIAVLAFAGTRIFSRKKTATTTKQPKTAGEIKPKTKQQLEAEKRQARREERKRKRELQKRLRAERKAARLARRQYGYYGYRRYGYGTYRGTRRGYRGSLSAASRIKKKTQLYQLTAIFIADGKYVALIDNQQYEVGDIIQGRKIVNILSDRIVIDEYGKTKEVKIGESILPSLVGPRR